MDGTTPGIRTFAVSKIELHLLVMPRCLTGAFRKVGAIGNTLPVIVIASNPTTSSADVCLTGL
jgi:hypothetical protein